MTDNDNVNDSLNDNASKHYRMSGHMRRPYVLDEDFVALVQAIEQELEMPVWLLLQGNGSQFDNDINSGLRSLFVVNEDQLPRDEPVALIIDSPGGSADDAYRIASLLQDRCGSFVAIVPRRAKSAATLLVMGADRVIMCRHGELGPLDVQIFDGNTLEYVSALNTVKSLEQLSSFALEVLFGSFSLLMNQTGRPVDTVVPFAIDYTAKLCQPLFAQVNVVQYTQTVRDLTVARDYAYRLLRGKGLNSDEAWETLGHFVEHYNAHGFVIGAGEARVYLPTIEKATGKLDDLLADLYPYLTDPDFVAIGTLEEYDIDSIALDDESLEEDENEEEGTTDPAGEQENDSEPFGDQEGSSEGNGSDEGIQDQRE